MRMIKTLITAAIAMALFAMPAGALAKRGDRNHDRIPDKWEKRHHLSTRVNVARKDPDKDGLNNLAEFRDGTDPQKADTDGDGVNDGTEIADDTNPRKDDSDGDGVDDGDEVSGTVVSFENNVLTIQLPGDGAGTVSGTVNDGTRVECDDNGDDDAQAPTTATASRDGSSDDSGSGDGDHSGSGDSGSGSTASGSDDSGSGSSTSGSGDDGSDQSGSDDGDNHDAGDDNSQNTCTSADLKPGARVHEAKTTMAADGSTVFTKIELVPAA